VVEGEAVVGEEAGVVGAGGELHRVSRCRVSYFVHLLASQVLVDISLGFHKNDRDGLCSSARMTILSIIFVSQ
jgi:hypothetical protein